MRSNVPIEIRIVERGVTEKPTCLIITCHMYGIRVWLYILMDGELGNETNIGLPLESSTMSPNYEICALKLVFLSFRRYLVEIGSNCRHARNFHTRFYLQMHYCVNVSASKFQVLICRSSRQTTFRLFILFLAGPARMYVQ